jgi:hypothetical protein
MSGQGLRFEGIPSDIEEFNWILAQSGCHPKAAERILTRLKQKGYDLLTVSDSLNFKWITMQLDTLGVRMTFIDPLENWSHEFNDGTWPEEVLNKVFAERDKQRKEFLGL